MAEVNRRAEIWLTPELVRSVFSLAEDVEVIGAEYDVRDGHISLILTGPRLPSCIEGTLPIVMPLADVQRQDDVSAESGE